MTTPFDAAIEAIVAAGYHNHRLEQHSDIVSDGIVKDLMEECAAFRQDVEGGVVQIWKNVSSPGDRERRVDLFVGEPDEDGKPDITKVRIAVENKSVITAHRNRTNRFDDLSKVLGAIQGARPEALLIATVLVGVSRRYLNIPDKVRSFFRDRDEEFENHVLPRLSSGDETLWDEFSWAISRNSAADPGTTVALFRSLPTRGPALTHVAGYDSLLIVPLEVDNVHLPSLPRPNELGIDVDEEYRECIRKTCRAYTARFHL